MSIQQWFPTSIYYVRLQNRGGTQFNRELLKECRQIREFDLKGQEWSAKCYPGGYTSYGSMAQLHKFSSTFAGLEEKISKHVWKFARHLGMDLRGRKVGMSDCWVNIMPRQVVHSLHLHPLSFMSGTYYVQTPKNCSAIKFEDPRLSKFMAAPPKLPRPGNSNKSFIQYKAEAGKLILFESWLRHEVPPNPIDGERISISFNYHWW